MEKPANLILERSRTCRTDTSSASFELKPFSSQVKAANVSPPPLCTNNPYSNYSSHYSSPYNMEGLSYFPPAHSMAQPPNYSSHYMTGSNFFRPPSLSSANTMSEYDSYNEKYQVNTKENLNFYFMLWQFYFLKIIFFFIFRFCSLNR